MATSVSFPVKNNPVLPRNPAFTASGDLPTSIIPPPPPPPTAVTNFSSSTNITSNASISNNTTLNATVNDSTSTSSDSSEKDLLSGIIFPPPELRNIIDKTAQFVAKNGREFENRVFKEQKNLRFAFLQSNNPYRPYYEMKVRQIMTGASAPQPAIPQAILDMKKKEEEQKKKKELLMLTYSYMDNDAFQCNYDQDFGSSTKLKQLENGNVASPIKPSKKVFRVDHPFITPLDVDIIKVTAQFVARNGNRFINGLCQREKNNTQFDFLKPSNILFSYFSSLVDCYTKCLLPDVENLKRLRDISENHLYCLSTAHSKFLHEEHQESLKKDQEEKESQEKLLLSQIDWHDFFVVETLEFTAQDNELDLPPPVDFLQPKLKIPIALSSENDSSKNSWRFAEDMDMDLEEDMEVEEDKSMMKNVESQQKFKRRVPTNEFDDYDEKQFEEKYADSYGSDGKLTGIEHSMSKDNSDGTKILLTDQEIDGISSFPGDFNYDLQVTERLAKTDENKKKDLKILSEYTHRKKRGIPVDESVESNTVMQKCPIIGKYIPAEDMSRHLKVLLLDPKWKQQRDKLLEKNKKDAASFAVEGIEANLASFVAKRPDLFGTVEDEIMEHAGIDSSTNTVPNATNDVNFNTSINGNLVLNNLVPSSMVGHTITNGPVAPSSSNIIMPPALPKTAFPVINSPSAPLTPNTPGASNTIVSSPVPPPLVPGMQPTTEGVLNVAGLSALSPSGNVQSATSVTTQMIEPIYGMIPPPPPPLILLPNDENQRSTSNE